MALVDTSMRTKVVYEALRSDILEGRLKPAHRLKLAMLGDRFSVSMSVVREALTRLTEQGLVVSSPMRGFMVMPLSVKDLLDITQTRIRLETMALRDSIERGDVAWEGRVLAAHHALNRAPEPRASAETAADWRQCHRAFHQALLGGCGSQRLQALANGLRDSAEIYRSWARSLARDGSRDLAAEHRCIMELTLASDADAAAAALAAHIERTTAALLTYVAGHADC